MITWRGIVNVKQDHHGFRFDLIKVKTLFEIYEDSTPATVLLSWRVVDLWPIDVFSGMGPAQIGNLILNVGLRREITGVPGVPPGTYSEPDPKPLRVQGAELLQDFEDTNLILDLPLPIGFNP